ncbi:MAG: lysostaphin resistance A-like protein [Verrucomicrobiota bacterium]
MPSQPVERYERSMNAANDPTSLVISAAFVVAALIFPIAAVIGALRRVPQSAGLDPLGPPRVLPPPLPFGKVSVGLYQPLDLLPVALIFSAFSLLVVSSLSAPASPDRQLVASDLVMNIGFQIFIAGTVLVYMMRRTTAADWLGLRWPAWSKVFFIAPASVFGMWLVFGVLQACGYMQWIESLGAETMQESVKLLQTTEDPAVLWLMALAAVLVAPLCEELLFRGYLYPVAKKFTGPWLAACSSALFFAAAHGNLSALLPLFLFGLLLVWIYEKTGSLWAPIAVHFCFNGATVTVQMAARYFNIPLDATP